MAYAFGKIVAKHPTLDIWCRSDGLVCTKGHGFGHNSRHWTKGSLNKKGYFVVGLDGHVYKVHRLIAETFLPNISNYPVVDHIDRNRQNNAVSNLRWASYQTNARNSENCERQKQRDGFNAFDNLSRYYHVRNAARSSNISEQRHNLWTAWAKKNKCVNFPGKKRLWLPKHLADKAMLIPFKERDYNEFKNLKEAV